MKKSNKDFFILLKSLRITLSCFLLGLLFVGLCIFCFMFGR